MAESILRGSQVDRSDLEERVYTELRRRIMARDLPPGTVLTLRQVAEALQVSATPVRDAFRRLENDGLVRNGGRQGVSVIGLGAGDIVDLFGARLALESHAVRVAADASDTSALDEMRGIAELFPETIEGDHYTDYERFRQLDIAFHQHIVAAARNARIVTMYQALNVHLHLARIYQKEIEQRAQANHQEHLAIVSAMAQQDRDETLRAVELHIVNVRDHILSKLEPGGLV